MSRRSSGGTHMGRRREVRDPAPPPPDALSDPVDEAGAESFPASDPPAWVPVHPGRPAPPTEPGGSDRKPVRRRLPDAPGSGGS
jgi:hypothetical protein